MIGLVLLFAIAPVQALAASAHAGSSTRAECAQCHKLHAAPTGRCLLEGADGSAVCFVCHGEAGGSDWNVETSAANSFGAGMKSGHVLEDVADPDVGVDLTNLCSSCHGPHGDPGLRANLPVSKEIVDTTPDTLINPEDPRTWCLTCHSADHAWYAGSETGGVVSIDTGLKAAYDALIQDPARDASHYPTLGTFPGPASYTVASSVHANIPAREIESAVNPGEPVTRVAGDCQWCHASHRSAADYDGLLGQYRPSAPTDASTGEYAQACFECHGNSSQGTASEVYTATGTTVLDDAYWADADADGDAQGAPDIYSLVTSGGSTSGHRVLTGGGYYEAGSPLPCYECHNPHGSKNDNSTMFSDALGANLDTSTAEGVRRFCFTCHTSYDTEGVTGRPYGWDSTAAEYLPVPADAEIVGLARNASAATEENRLRLWDVTTGHDHDDTQDCLTACHGDVHAPMGSPVGATNCFDSSCHSALHGMVDDATSYHHVLDSATPDQAPGEDGTYPVFSETNQELSCVSCHVDHTEWDALGNSYNLRSSGLDVSPTPSNTDEDLCLSCHSYTLSFRIYRSIDGTTPTPDGQADNVLPATAVMRVEDDYWTASPHNYPASTYFADGSEFVGNCSKCHGTLEPGQYTQTEPFSFTVHYSPEQRLLNALGQDRSSLSAPQTAAVNEEDMCFRCHSNSTDKLGVSNRDYYGTQLMSTANRAIGEQMDPANNVFGHKPAAYYKKHLISSIDEPQSYLGTVVGGVAVNKHVECADCHNHHIVGKSRHIYGTTNLVSDALLGVRGVGFKSGELAALVTSNWPTADPISYGSGVDDELEYKQMALYEYEVCFKCHSSANADAGGTVALGAWGGKMVWTVWPAQTTGTKTTVDNWTNVAQDFNVGNNSRHPVFATLDGYYYDSHEDYEYDEANDFSTDSKVRVTGYLDKLSDPVTHQTSTLLSDQVAYGWEPGDTMVCSDCHGDSRAPYAMNFDGTPNPAAETVPQGPHGASVRFSLRGPNTNWPVWSDSGSLITLQDMFDGKSGVFCTNCHPADRVRDNKVHRSATMHKTTPCISCHLLVPHGGKMSRLIADRDGVMPARLAYRGEKANILVLSFQKAQDPATGYTSNSCAVDSSCSGSHKKTTSQTGGTWENW